jgi:hypothetical protein
MSPVVLSRQLSAKSSELNPQSSSPSPAPPNLNLSPPTRVRSSFSGAAAAPGITDSPNRALHVSVSFPPSPQLAPSNLPAAATAADQSPSMLLRIRGLRLANLGGTGESPAPSPPLSATTPYAIPSVISLDPTMRAGSPFSPKGLVSPSAVTQFHAQQALAGAPDSARSGEHSPQLRKNRQSRVINGSLIVLDRSTTATPSAENTGEPDATTTSSTVSVVSVTSLTAVMTPRPPSHTRQLSGSPDNARGRHQRGASAGTGECPSGSDSSTPRKFPHVRKNSADQVMIRSAADSHRGHVRKQSFTLQEDALVQEEATSPNDSPVHSKPALPISPSVVHPAIPISSSSALDVMRAMNTPRTAATLEPIKPLFKHHAPSITVTTLVSEANTPESSAKPLSPWTADSTGVASPITMTTAATATDTKKDRAQKSSPVATVPTMTTASVASPAHLTSPANIALPSRVSPLLSPLTHARSPSPLVTHSNKGSPRVDVSVPAVLVTTPHSKPTPISTPKLPKLHILHQDSDSPRSGGSPSLSLRGNNGVGLPPRSPMLISSISDNNGNSTDSPTRHPSFPTRVLSLGVDVAKLNTSSPRVPVSPSSPRVQAIIGMGASSTLSPRKNAQLHHRRSPSQPITARAKLEAQMEADSVAAAASPKTRSPLAVRVKSPQTTARRSNTSSVNGSPAPDGAVKALPVLGATIASTTAAALAILSPSKRHAFSFDRVPSRNSPSRAGAVGPSMPASPANKRSMAGAAGGFSKAMPFASPKHGHSPVAASSKLSSPKVTATFGMAVAAYTPASRRSTMTHAASASSIGVNALQRPSKQTAAPVSSAWNPLSPSNGSASHTTSPSIYSVAATAPSSSRAVLDAGPGLDAAPTAKPRSNARKSLVKGLPVAVESRLPHAQPRTRALAPLSSVSASKHTMDAVNSANESAFVQRLLAMEGKEDRSTIGISSTPVQRTANPKRASSGLNSVRANVPKGAPLRATNTFGVKTLLAK